MFTSAMILTTNYVSLALEVRLPKKEKEEEEEEEEEEEKKKNSGF